MSWVTVLWSMGAAVCLALAAMHLLIWLKRRTAWGHLLLSSSAIAAASIAGFELVSMRTESPEQYGMLLRWAHIPLWVLFVSLVWFVRLYLHAGRLWLAWIICGLRTLALALNFLFTPNLNYREITAIRHVQWPLGETISEVVGTPNPWTLIGQFSFLLFLVYIADATIAVWRRGDRERALVIGGSTFFFISVSLTQSALVVWGAIKSPFLISFPYLGIVLAMGYELSMDVHRAAQLYHELQRSEAGLRKSEERMALAAEAAKLGISIQDLARKEIQATDGWRTLYGFANSDRLDIDGYLQRLHPEDREIARQRALKATASNDSYDLEYRVLFPNGQIRWIASRSRVEFDGAGKAVFVHGVSQDITARKDTEMETQLLRQEIAHVGRVTMLGQLASALAHEINQPLGAILRNAEAAERFMQNGPPDSGEMYAILADIRKDGQRAGDVIDRMRTLLKRRDLEARALGVGELVSDVAALIWADATARQVTLYVNVPGELPAVRGDRVHLEQVLLNLILNGMDALKDAGRDNRRVAITARLADSKMVEIAVSDTGHGIPEDKIAGVFDPFFTTKSNGLGMGLPISRTIIEAHGGRLCAENNAGAGATFRFTVPIAAEVKAP